MNTVGERLRRDRARRSWRSRWIKAEKIAGRCCVGSEAPTIHWNQAADRLGEAIDGGVLPGGGDAIPPATKLPAGLDQDGRSQADPGRPGGGAWDPGQSWMGLAPGEILADVERLEEGVLIAIGALERAVDRLAIVRQIALDAMEE